MNGTENGITRRDVLIGAAGGLAAALAPAGPAQAAPEAATISGFVFEDLDGSGRRDAKSPGVANALVSNGRDVAVTDAGRALQPAAAGRGDDLRHQAGRLHAAGRRDHALPRFYRHHRPMARPPRSN